MRDSESDEEERFNASFWRTPIGPPPELEPTPAPSVALSHDERSANSLQQEQDNHPKHREQQQKPMQEQPTSEQIRKLNEKLVPQMLLPTPSEMTIEHVKEELLAFQASWYKQHHRPVKPSDTPALPRRIAELYDELGRRLTPEQVAADQAKAKARQVAEDECAAKREAEVAAAAAQRKAIAEARAKEWEEFEKNKEAAWRAAKGEAEDQREEVADEKGVSSIALTGASTFVKIDQGEKDTRLTSEQYIEQCKADFGLLEM